MSRFRTALVAIIAGFVASLSAAPAAAYDASPCTLRHGKHICPLWRGWVPVHAAPSSKARIVGYLVRGGNANWFVAQCAGSRASYPARPYVNEWWAKTMADNWRWGWVSEIFFKGGANMERDAGLPVVPGRIC